jgi:malonyl CoA-acyl carrier protein transacylase
MSLPDNLDIAIVGWSCRLAGSSRVEALPRHPGEHARDPATAASALREVNYFDAPFFGFTPQEASALRADQCILLELAHEALEQAGHDPSRQPDRIGTFVGFAKPVPQVDGGSETRGAWISSHLGLTGARVSVEEPEHPFVKALLQASQSLLSGETEIALTGAFSDSRESALSGRARGGGVLVLKSLAKALAARDTVYAIIREVTFSDTAPAQEIRGSDPASEVAAFIDAAGALKLAPGPVSRSINSGARTANVLFEAVAQQETTLAAPGPYLLTLSAKTGKSLDQVTLALREFLEGSESVNMGDAAKTLQSGREAFAHRRMLVCAGREDALTALTGKESNRVFSGRLDTARRPAVFMMPGIGDQYVGMAHDLYSSWEVFRQEVDRCAKILEPHLGIDIRNALYPANQAWKKVVQSKGIDLKRMMGRTADEPVDPDTALLNTTRFAQPAMFTLEYAMAHLWLSLGITPDAIVGHSMGEYVAACLAGVLSLEDALRLIAVRARLINELPQAIMLAVMQPEDELRAVLPPGVFISLINGPSHCVIAGPPEAVTAVEQVLAEREIIARRVQNGHAFHTPMMEPVLAPFEAEVRKVQLNAPRIPYISNVTGDWVTVAQATDPTYWIRHLSHTARFSDGLSRLWQLENPLLIECGPGRTLSVLAAQHPDRKATLQSGIWSIRQRYENDPDERVLQTAIGKVWLAGRAISWDRMAGASERRQIPLPGYPHENEQCWTSSAPTAAPSNAVDSSSSATATATAESRGEDDRPANPREQALVRIWQNALGRPDLGVNDGFGALGGDSLSSIGVVMEMKRLGIPDDIARGLYRGLTIRQIARQADEGGSTSVVRKIQLSSVDTGVFVRAIAIFVVVAGHFGMTDLIANPVLMIISGMSFAKYQLQTIAKEKNIWPVFNFSLRIAIPAFLYTLLRQAMHGSIHVKSLFLVDNLLEPWPFGDYQSPYFVDLLIQNVVIAAIPLTIASIRRFAIEKPYSYAMIFLLVSFLANLAIHSIWDPSRTWLFVPQMYMWLLALGWCAACSTADSQKIITTIALLSLTWISAYWGTGILTWYMVVAALALIWFEEIPAQIPRGLVTVINGAAAASLIIYLTHGGFKFLLRIFPPLLSVACAMVCGYLVWMLWNYATRITLGWFGKRTMTSAPSDSW